MDTLLQDVRHAARSLLRSPGFSFTAVVTLALGIGAATAIFSVVRAVLLKPLPYEHPGRLAIVWSDLRKRNLYDFPLPPGDFDDMRRSSTMFEGLAGLNTFRAPVSGEDVPPEQVIGAAVTPNLFHVLGVKVALGRDFTDEDGTPQAQAPQPAGPPAQSAAPRRLPATLILSHEFWQRRFGGERSVIGRTLTIGGNAANVVGVLEPGVELLFPPGTSVERHPAFYIALRTNFADTSIAARINVFMRTVGRLKPGVTYAQAQAQLDVLAADLRQRYQIKEAAGMYFRVESMAKDLVADVETPVLALMGAVVFVLLIACANVANLLLVRAAGRGHELAVRAALGGSRGRLVRQLLAESLVLAGAGAALGLVFARLGISMLLAIGPEDLPRLDTVAIDPLVLTFAVLATVVAAAVFGVAPALRASQAEAADALRSGARSVGRRGRLSSGVVIAEVALSFVLLVGSGLMVRSFVALTRTDPGYRPQGLLTFIISNFRGANTPELRSARIRELHDRLAAVPGVRAVTSAGPFPLDGRIQNARYWTEAAQSDPSLFQQADVHIVQPGYFQALGTRLLEGRDFTEADNRPGANVVVIDNQVAAKAFPHESAVGKRLFARFRSNQPELVDIIGVVAHQRHASLTTAGREAVFFADGQFGFGGADRWGLRTDGDPARLGPAVRAAIQAVDPLLVVSELQPMSVLVDKAQAQTRFALICIAVFAAIAVLLAAVGLYGVLATLVRQRTSEIGVRLAFGAEPAGILKLVVGQGLRLSAAGLVLGLVAALALTRVMAHMLVDVTPTDPVTFVSIAALFLVIVTFASWLPARRAARVDPMVALRGE